MNGAMHAPVTDRVRANTWVPVNDRLNSEAQLRMREAAASASTDELTRRITQLDYGWDFDRTVETEASVMGLLGLLLGIAVDKRFLVLPAFVSTMLVAPCDPRLVSAPAALPAYRCSDARRDRSRTIRTQGAPRRFRGASAGSPAAERAGAAWKALRE
jgi:hypothetical protein